MVIEGVGLSFGGRTIFDEIGLRLDERDRVGLIGPNGSGKTSLLRILAKQQEIDRGRIVSARGTHIGYLPQELVVNGGIGLLDFVLSSVPGRTDMENELATAEAELESTEATPEAEERMMMLATHVADLHERLDHFDRYFSEHQALSILAGLGFVTSDSGRDMGEFSGGWQMRAVLAALLFQRPDILLLDEPTNHLDLPSVAWFSKFLKQYPRCFILISHDREFLDEQIDRVVSIEPEGLRMYKGNLSAYDKQRAEEEEILLNKAKNLARERERLQRFVDRFRAQANKAAAVQSRVKALEKMDDVELYQRRKTLRFEFPPVVRAAGEVLRVQSLRKAYGDHVVFSGINLTVERGDKIGIIGVNGAGKTTLLKIMAGELAQDDGRIAIGGLVQLGYYAQHHADTLDLGSTVYDVVARANPDALPARVRSVLGAFLFSGDDVEKPVSVLSGGERARVALARLLINPGNVLLMDEPTNHLDLSASESLAASLSAFDGTLVFVSHNRSLIRTVATKIWNVEDGRVETYAGTLDEYMYSSQLRREELVNSGAVTATAARVAPTAVADANAAVNGASNAESATAKGTRETEKARKRREAELRNQRSKLLKPIEKRVQKLEDRISELEEAQKERSALLSDPEVYEDQSRRDKLLGEYQQTADKLEELTARWEAAQQELDEAESQFAEQERLLLS